MALLAPSPFPAPALFPRPSPDPQTFGLDPFEARSPAGLYLPQETQIQTPFANAISSQMESSLNQALGASGPPTDDMTLDEAKAQTDRALARVANVNPELAQQLAFQRDQNPEQERGFWGSVLGAVAESPIGKALELVSRPFRIIPEIWTDSDESVWKNIGDALSGKSDATMGDVLDKYGIFQGDDFLSKAMHGIAGFALDVAVDPLTYLTLGLGAVGRVASTRFAAETGARAVMYREGTSILDRVVSDVGRKALNLADDATLEVARGKAFEHVWRGVTSKRESLARLGRASSLDDMSFVVHPDFAGGPLGVALREGEREVLLKATQVAQEAHKIVGKFGFNKLSPKLAEHLGLPLDDVTKILEGMKRAGKFATREDYMRAKFAGGLLGGWRWSVPGVRIVSPAIWGTAKVDFSIARRFMAGLSGQMRIMKAVQSGALAPEVGKKALEAATLGGWKKVVTDVPQVAQLFGGRGGRLGSAFANASWQIGGITRNLGPASLVRGGGLGDALASDARKMVRVQRSKLIAEATSMVSRETVDADLLPDVEKFGAHLNVVGDVVKRGDGVWTQPEVQRTIHQLDRAAVEKSGDPLLTIQALEVFPTAEAQRMGADAWYDRLEAEARLRFGADDGALEGALARIESRRQLARTVEQRLAEVPEAGLAARMYREVANKTREIYNEMGGHASNATIATEAQRVEMYTQKNSSWIRKFAGKSFSVVGSIFPRGYWESGRLQFSD